MINYPSGGQDFQAVHGSNHGQRGRVMDFLHKIDEGVRDCFHDTCHIVISIYIIVTIWQQGSHVICAIIMMINGYYQYLNFQHFHPSTYTCIVAIAGP